MAIAFRFIIILSFFTLTACESQEVGDLSDGSVTDPSSDISSGKSERIYLKTATDDQIEAHIYEEDGEERVIICHVPPGNPSNSHNIVVSANAFDAHLKHGSRGNGHGRAKNGAHQDSDIYKEGDYLGACGAPELRDDIIILDDPVFDTDGVVCEDLMGDELYECLAEHNQNITVEL